jgi:hypothetical protein
MQALGSLAHLGDWIAGGWVLLALVTTGWVIASMARTKQHAWRLLEGRHAAPIVLGCVVPTVLAVVSGLVLRTVSVDGRSDLVQVLALVVLAAQWLIWALIVWGVWFHRGAPS